MCTGAMVKYGKWALCHLVKSNTKKEISAEKYFIEVFPVSIKW